MVSYLNPELPHSASLSSQLALGNLSDSDMLGLQAATPVQQQLSPEDLKPGLQ